MTEYEGTKYFLCSQKADMWNDACGYFISSYTAFIYNKISLKAKPKTLQVYMAFFFYQIAEFEEEKSLLLDHVSPKAV